MLVISVRLLHGTLRAGSPHDTVAAGDRPEGEWPPSPARLLSALVAADGTRERCTLTSGRELQVLEGLRPPRIVADRMEQVGHTELLPRFVVGPGTERGATQEYVGRKATEVQPGVRASPLSSRIAYVWEEDVATEVVDALRTRASRVGYLGCADSPVHVTVATSTEPVPGAVWLPGSPSGTPLPVPYPGFVAALDEAFDAWSAGVPTRRSWVPTRWDRYDVHPDHEPREEESGSSVIWLEFDRPVPAHRALLVSETTRAAVLQLVDEASPSDAGGQPPGRRAPWMLHGHDVPDEVARPYQLARYLPLMNVGGPHADGAVRGVAIWLPVEATHAVVELVRSALTRLHSLRAPGLDVEVAVRSGAPRPWTTHPARWVGPSASWSSATPVILERGRRGGPDVEDVRRWFVHAGHPVPGSVTVHAVPTLPGAPKLRPSEVHHGDIGRHPYVWIEVTFDEPVTGPMCVGRGRSFGMGLLAPAATSRPIANRQGAA